MRHFECDNVVETDCGRTGTKAVNGGGDNILIVGKSEFSSRDLDLAGLTPVIVGGTPYRLTRIDTLANAVIFTEETEPPVEFYRASA